MIVGVLKEVKKMEYRVSLLPVGVEALVTRGHTVLVQAGAGEGSGFMDKDYEEYGATILPTAKDVYAQAEMILKVKEPQPQEYEMIRKDQIVFTYLHYAASRELTDAMIKSEAVTVAYETIEGPKGGLPLLTPMSEVAGRMSVQIGANYLFRTEGGRGVLLGGVPGAEPATVVILGGGVVGTHAAQMAAGLGAKTYILDVDLDRLRYLSEIMPANVYPMMSNAHNIRALLKKADLVVSGVLIRGGKAPKLVTRKTLTYMRKGAVIVDVAIDQGGSMETSRPTDHEHPVYTEEGIIHYCVTNMPGAVPETSTIALTNATLPYILKLADRGLKALVEDKGMGMGANIVKGKVTHMAVADAFDMEYTPLEEALECGPVTNGV